MLDHYRCLAVDGRVCAFILSIDFALGEGLRPTLIAERLQILVGDVGSHDAIDKQLSETLKFVLGFANCFA